MQENGDDCGVFVCKVVCKKELYDNYDNIVNHYQHFD